MISFMQDPSHGGSAAAENDESEHEDNVEEEEVEEDEGAAGKKHRGAGINWTTIEIDPESEVPEESALYELMNNPNPLDKGWLKQLSGLVGCVRKNHTTKAFNFACPRPECAFQCRILCDDVTAKWSLQVSVRV
jgi:hypothetical protein